MFKFHHQPVKTVLSKKRKRDNWFLDEFSINPYLGCSFNCRFCYVESSHYDHHIPGHKVAVKQNLLEILDFDLAKAARKNQYAFITLSTATDPYLYATNDDDPIREILKLILNYKFPVHIITRSNRVIRDIDLLLEIDKIAILPADLKNMNGTLVTFSFTTLDEKISKLVEPAAPLIDDRLHALTAITKQGLHAGVALMPILPFISDEINVLDNMFKQFQEAGAKWVLPASLTLNNNLLAGNRPAMYNMYKCHFPEHFQAFSRFFNNRSVAPFNYHQVLNANLFKLHEKYQMPAKINSLKE